MILKEILPKHSVFLNISCLFPDEIEKLIDSNLKLSNCLILFNDHVWRYSKHFSEKNYNAKIIIVTIGYENLKYSDNYVEISYPSWYFQRSKSISVHDKQRGLNYGFGCLNNRTSIERILLGYSLFKEKLLDNIIFSQNLYPHHEAERNLNIFFEHPFIFEYFDFSRYDEYRSLLPIIAENEKRYQSPFTLDHTIQHNAYLKTYCNIITENECESWPYYQNENLPVITEKSYKPFLSKQIPLYLAARGHLRYLKKYGFETMDDFVPRNYDNFNTIEKIKAIVEIVKLGKEYVEDFYFSHLREINHNYQLVLSDKVESIIKQELVEFLNDI